MKMISVVIPNFNGARLLERNLPKLIGLLKKSKLEHEIIVCDDFSTDDSLSNLSNVRNLRVISSEKNLGFGTNVDRGIREAKGEIVFVLNAIDILPKSQDYFKIMLKHFENPKVFSVAAVKRDEEDHGNGRIYFEKGFFLHRRTPNISNSPNLPNRLISAWADGGAQALRKEYYLKIGGFDPLYKFYWEDVDLGYRAWKAGYRVDFEGKALLTHQKSEGPIAKFYSERQRRVMNLRNQFIFTWKNGDWQYLCRYFLWEPYHFAVAIKNGDWDFFRAYWQAMLLWPRILVARWRQKKIAKLTDNEVLRNFVY